VDRGQHRRHSAPRSLTDSLGGRRCSSASASLIQPLRPHSTHASAPNLSLTHTQPTAKMSSTAEEDRIKRVQVRTEEGRQQRQTTIRLRPSLTAALPPSSSAASSLIFFVVDRDKQMRSPTSRGEMHAQRGDSCSAGRPQHAALLQPHPGLFLASTVSSLGWPD